MDNRIKRIAIIVTVAILAVAFALSAFTVIAPTQRGVKVTLGKAGDTVLQPGMVFKIPLMQTVKKYDLSPKQLEMNFSMGSDAAVTSDMQSVACSIVVYWTYDESRILDIVNGYNDQSIKNIVKDNTLGAIKEVIGKYSIYEIVEKQDEVTEKTKASLTTRLSNYPVVVSNVTINNWDWSDEFDKQIANTMAMTQQVKLAQQELEVTKQQAQKDVAQAEADRQKAEIEAQMRVTVAEQNALAAEAEAKGAANATKIKAEGEAEARKIEGEGEASYYQSLLPYIEVIQTMRSLEIDKVRAENWNGVEVSTYLPMTANGTLVSLD